MKKLIIALILILLLMATVVPAFAHVHGVTPLAVCTADNANSGGNGTNGTPADDANGGPITGLIPRDTGSGNIALFGGGFGAATGNCP